MICVHAYHSHQEGFSFWTRFWCVLCHLRCHRLLPLRRPTKHSRHSLCHVIMNQRHITLTHRQTGRHTHTHIHTHTHTHTRLIVHSRTFSLQRHRNMTSLNYFYLVFGISMACTLHILSSTLFIGWIPRHHSSRESCDTWYFTCDTWYFTCTWHFIDMC